MSGGPEPDLAVLEAARTLAADRTTAEVVSEFRQAGIRSILLKGPAIELLLYSKGERPYLDADLLVAPDQLRTAEHVLVRLRFEEQPVDHEPAIGEPHARAWFRPDDKSNVDLHRVMAGVGVAPHELWHVVSPLTERHAVAGVEVEVPSAALRALIVTLHAAQHGPDREQSLEDLRRAVDRLDRETWAGAAGLAKRLDATILFSMGLRMDPRGVELARELGLPAADLVEASRAAGSPTRMALGFERLAGERGIGRKAALLARELLPPPRHMRWWSPLARRGLLGLAGAYLVRLERLLHDALPSFLAWRRARRRR